MMMISAGIAAVGSVQQANAQRKAGEAQAKMLNKEAESSMDAASRNMRDLSTESERLKGRQRAAMATSGSAGETYFDVLADTAYQAKKDEVAIAYDANLKHWQSSTEAKFAKAGAKNAYTSGVLQGMGTLIGGMSNVSDAWSRWKKTSAGAMS
jgi:hypothetical protein